MIHLVPMAKDDFLPYISRLVRDYANQKVRAGNYHPDEALANAQAETDRLLPAGLDTPDQYIYSAIDEASAEKVGVVWFAVLTQGRLRFAFVYDLEVYPAYQRRGYGEAIMRTLEGEVARLGLDTISLHVFGHNQAARAMYEKLGYQITNISMSKKIDALSSTGEVEAKDERSEDRTSANGFRRLGSRR
jgi:ribosomal protein S18 acetylase RimI-like enzyme